MKDIDNFNRLEERAWHFQQKLEEFDSMGEFIDEAAGITSENEAWESEEEAEKLRWEAVIKKAEVGAAEMQYELGLGYAGDRWMLAHDLSDEDRQAKAAEWLHKAAEQGHEKAAAELANTPKGETINDPIRI